MKNISVAVCVPCRDHVHTEFMKCLFQMLVFSYSQGVVTALLEDRCTILEIGRNTLIEKAVALDTQWILFLDSDMTFPPETLVELLSVQEDIVCTDAVTRRPPHTQVCLGLDEKPIDHEKTDSEAVEVMGLSTGICLIRTSAFDRIPKPWFLVEYNEKDGYLGEDFYFGNRARVAGYKLWCASKLSKKIGHIGTKEFKLGGGV